MLEYEAAFTGSVCQTFNSAMEKISATVECDGGDTLCESALCDCLADDCSCLDTGFAFALCCKLLVVGCSCYESLTLLVIDNLHVNLLVAAENDHTGTLSSTIDVLADAVVDSSSSFNSIECHNSILLLFSCCGLTCLATKCLAQELDTFTLVRLGLTE